ncbi:hypothetical protein [Rhodoferax sp.]|uniref:hypothetical protein n=1 Tax=Rhodoferax sp. TaxID=50421 RepID=UPI00276EF043|nr:hypothetical protein [Rhodoferax sp.]
MPTSTSVVTGTTTVEPTAGQAVSHGGSGVDRLASELRALRLQAQSTEAELAKLQQQTPARSPVDALRGADAALGAGAVGLALGLVALVWWWRRRRAVRAVGAGVAVAAESGFLPVTPVVRPAHATLRPGAQAAPVMPVALNRPPTVAAVVAPAVSRPMVQDSAFRPSSLDVTFIEHDALDASMMPPLASRHDSPFAAPDLSLEFDPEAAASEVGRVRKSLATKRSERSRLFAPGPESAWRDDDPTDEPDSARQSDTLRAGSPGAPIVPTAATASAGVDVLIDFPDHAAQSTPTNLPVDAAEPHEQAPEPDRELDVSVSLIQELQGLGLWSEARELAKEVVKSAQAPLDADIASSLHRLQHGTPASGGERRKKERG